MSKPKYSAELKIQIAKEYIAGKGSYDSLEEKYKVTSTTVKSIVRKYLAQGEAAFAPRCGNAKYSSGFKIKCVETVLRGEDSVNDVTAKYNISDRSVLRS